MVHLIQPLLHPEVSVSVCGTGSTCKLLKEWPQMADSNKGQQKMLIAPQSHVPVLVSFLDHHN